MYDINDFILRTKMYGWLLHPGSALCALYFASIEKTKTQTPAEALIHLPSNFFVALVFRSLFLPRSKFHNIGGIVHG
jgi:hypothetical protein